MGLHSDEMPFRRSAARCQLQAVWLGADSQLAVSVDTIICKGSLYVMRLRQRSTSQNVAGLIPDKSTGFFSIPLILPAELGPRVYSASNINEYQESPWG
jgi:hypothetical protein